MRPGNPVRAMLAQRLSDAAEILAKLGGQCSAEYKYDGVRVQAHRTADGEIELYTRRLERISAQFPDVVELLAAGLGPAEAIVEGEVVAYDADAGELRPFGEVMLRRRKYGIDQARRDVPVGLFCFELLYADGQDLTQLPYPQRRAALAAAITPSARLRLTSGSLVADPAALDAAFEQAITDGCEGLVCKSVGPTAVYQAGSRGWQWIKLKRDYRTELSDTADLAVVGAYAGRGRRAGGYGAVLLAAYDADADVFRTVSKCGTGFSDADLAELPARLAPLISAGTARPGGCPAAAGRVVRARAGAGDPQRRARPCRRTTPRAGAGSRRTPGWPCGSPGSPGAGATTRPPRTPLPPANWSSCSAPRGGRRASRARPADGAAGLVSRPAPRQGGQRPPELNPGLAGHQRGLRVQGAAARVLAAWPSLRPGCT